ncbi:MAG: NAD(P)-dependent oxidoreductase [Collinsella sp.]
MGPVTSLKNANVLVLGAGDIGGHFATLCRSMGAHVRGIKRHPLVYPIVFEDMDGMDALSEAPGEADDRRILYAQHTRDPRLANAEFFAAMKPGAFFANGGRGDLVVADDLVAALESGHSPAPRSMSPTLSHCLTTSPLWDAPNMLITPHVSRLVPPGSHAQQCGRHCRGELRHLQGRRNAPLLIEH